MEEEILLKITQLIDKPVQRVYISMSQFNTEIALSYVIGDENKLFNYDQFELSYDTHKAITRIIRNYLQNGAKARNVNFLFWEYDVFAHLLTEETLTVKDEKEYSDWDFDDLTHAFFASARKKLIT